MVNMTIKPSGVIPGHSRSRLRLAQKRDHDHGITVLRRRPHLNDLVGPIQLPSSYRDPMGDFDTDEAPWPKAGDDPFAIARNSRLVACLNFTHDEPWGGYAEGFKRLADIGVAHIEETRRSHDFLVYPIIFSYRHFIELTLKEVIRNATRLLDKPVAIPSTHNLSALWETAEPLLREIEPETAPFLTPLRRTPQSCSTTRLRSRVHTTTAGGRTSRSTIRAHRAAAG